LLATKPKKKKSFLTLTLGGRTVRDRKWREGSTSFRFKKAEREAEVSKMQLHKYLYSKCKGPLHLRPPQGRVVEHDHRLKDEMQIMWAGLPVWPGANVAKLAYFVTDATTE
jgi:hypothetical protein